MQAEPKALSCKLFNLGSISLVSFSEANVQHNLDTASPRARLSSANNRHELPFKIYKEQTKLEISLL